VRDPEVTNFETQNGTAASTTATSAAGSAASPSVTEIAAFTAPNGGKYTATAIDGTLRIAGYQLSVGGPDALVGGVRVSMASEGLLHGDSTAAYATVTGASTSQVLSTSTNEAGGTQVVSSTATVAQTGSSTGTASRSGSTAASSSAASATAASTGGAAAGATAKSRGAVVALGSIAVLLCMFA
jgi:hypothetical protein